MGKNKALAHHTSTYFHTHHNILIGAVTAPLRHSINSAKATTSLFAIKVVPPSETVL